MNKYMLIYNDIKNDILKGEYKPYQQLPFEKELGEFYSVSKMTVKKAMDMLVDDGLIIKRRGAGTFVKNISKKKMEDLIISNQFKGLTALHPTKKVCSKILHFEICPASKSIKKKLGLLKTTSVYNIYRIRYIGENLYSLEQIFMPVELVPRLKKSTVENSIYTFIKEELNLKIKSVYKKITARKSTNEESLYLGLQEDEPVVVVEQLGYLNSGEAFELSISVHRYDDFELEIFSDLSN